MDKYRYRYIIEDYMNDHEIMKATDLLKLCYQGCYGPQHLMKDLESAKRYFCEEYRAVVPCEGKLFEKISPSYIRVHMGSYKMANLSPEWLFEMFVCTMEDMEEQKESLEEVFLLIEEVLGQGEYPVSVEEWKKCSEDYLKGESAPVHHSEEYREAENPHYRVVSAKYAMILPILELMAKRQNEGKKAVTFEYHEDYTGELVAMPVESIQKKRMVLAIEGRAAGGKSTLAKELNRITRAPIIKMDHFFLPKSFQKPKRLKEPGGNIHYERFIEEVIHHIKEDYEFSYTIYDCEIGGPNGIQQVPAMPWRIVEGSYSLHPKFGEYADVKIFVDVSPEEQMQRIRVRNGLEMARKFREEWIPMEEVYFHVNRLEKNADIIYDGWDRGI